MTTHASAEYADLFFEHLGALRDYAERVFQSGEYLSDDEEADRAIRARKFFEVGQKCEFTEQQLVRLVFSELFN